MQNNVKHGNESTNKSAISFSLKFFCNICNQVCFLVFWLGLAKVYFYFYRLYQICKLSEINTIS